MDKKLFVIHEYMDKHVFDVDVADNNHNNYMDPGSRLLICRCGCPAYLTQGSYFRPNKKWSTMQIEYPRWNFRMPFELFIEEVNEYLNEVSSGQETIHDT